MQQHFAHLVLDATGAADELQQQGQPGWCHAGGGL